eukprot:TRINITY_DN2667_c0_g1_i1.p1 TRINITY_DN2667_c0_g1~~TRINITY_DN2667_c0_g1_i1.p1  ORF type:complete len:274 (+),score=50.13 TRINITY_DN2667_c0_g1_i1:82-822(+)
MCIRDRHMSGFQIESQPSSARNLLNSHRGSKGFIFPVRPIDANSKAITIQSRDDDTPEKSNRRHRNQAEMFGDPPGTIRIHGRSVIEEAKFEDDVVQSISVNIEDKKCLSEQVENSEIKDYSAIVNRSAMVRQKKRTRLKVPVPITEFQAKEPVAKEKEENNPVDQSVSTCLVCFDRSPDAVVMPCGHGGLCYDCAVEIWEKTEECYLCRKPVTQILQIDLASRNADVMKIISYTDKVEVEINSHD